jgi:hypothetical protein
VVVVEFGRDGRVVRQRAVSCPTAPRGKTTALRLGRQPARSGAPLKFKIVEQDHPPAPRSED